MVGTELIDCWWYRFIRTSYDVQPFDAVFFLSVILPLKFRLFGLFLALALGGYRYFFPIHDILFEKFIYFE